MNASRTKCLGFENERDLRECNGKYLINLKVTMTRLRLSNITGEQISGFK